MSTPNEILEIRLALIETYRTFTLEYAGFSIALVVALITELNQFLAYWNVSGFPRMIIVGLVVGTSFLAAVSFIRATFHGHKVGFAITNSPKLCKETDKSTDQMKLMNEDYDELALTSMPRLKRIVRMSIFNLILLAVIVSVVAGLIAYW